MGNGVGRTPTASQRTPDTSGAGNRARVGRWRGKSTPRSRQNETGGNRPQSAVNLPLGGIYRGCGQIHGERGRGRGRGKEKAEAGTLRRRRHSISAYRSSVRVHRPPASPASPHLLLPVRTCSSCTSGPARPSASTGRTCSRRPSAPALLPPSPVRLVRSLPPLCSQALCSALSLVGTSLCLCVL